MSKRNGCFFCGAPLEKEAEFCPACGQDLRIAMLVCVQPTGQHAVGTQWPLYPRDYSVGRDPANDIVINDISVSRNHLRLRYEDGFFQVNYVVDNKPRRELKVDAQQITIGDGQLRVQYLNELDVDEYREEATRVFPVALSTANLAHKMSSAAEIQRMAVDAVLAITEMDNGYFMTLKHVDGEIQLEVNVGRNSDLKDITVEDSPVSLSFLEKVIGSKGEIIHMDAENIPAKHLSRSIVKFNLKRILCVPLLDHAGQLRSLIYVDTNTLKSIHKSTLCWKPALRMLGDLLAVRLEQLAKPRA